MNTSLHDLCKKQIETVTYYNGIYYVQLKPESFYENEIWQVNEQTGKTEPMFYTDYLVDIEDKARPIDVKVFKQWASKF